MPEVKKATHSGKVRIGEIELDCAVLEDGTRVLSQRAMARALGSKRGGSHWRRAKKAEGAPMLPVYLSAGNLSEFIDSRLEEKLTTPIEYILPKPSGARGHGVEAALVPQICDVYLKARDKGKLLRSQEPLAIQADMLMRGLAHVGIIALIDEATGYQKDREKDELAKLLAVYLSEERLKWARMFPEEFYRQVYRIMGWRWPTGTSRRPALVGRITNEIVYERLPEGVLGELKKRNPVDPSTRRRAWKHTQFLSEDIGQPDLRTHLLQVIAIMRAATNYKGLIKMLDMALPKPGAQQQLPIDI